ncbi:MAG: site-specific DNA-methyltransferase [Thermoflexia bacterium]|nr:MAG: site-specific DNA-methyltransferase [Thermoflexia bacterium]
MRAHRWLHSDRSAKLREFRSNLDNATRAFLDYWFLPSTQEELAALIAAIQEEADTDVRRLLQIAFSSTVVTKSGGVSLARDLAYSRPHRDPEKRPANPLDLFWERVHRYRRALLSEQMFSSKYAALMLHGDARALPLKDCSVHLIVTSPPYANAIDYRRAHKFSLVWMGWRIGELSQWRSRYIGAERAQEGTSPLPPGTQQILLALANRDPRKARVLRKYFADMRQAIREMYRVLRPGAAAIVVIGPSVMRGILVETHLCLAEIAAREGFSLAGIGERRLDRDRRMMPVSSMPQPSSPIELRMHYEYVIGLVKPEGR